jgi:hypothetical protein
MSAKTFRLVHAQARNLAAQYALHAPDGTICTFSEPRRTLEQSARFHAICSDVAKSKFPWAGKPRSASEWKTLFVSGHAVATKEGAEVIPGLETEFVSIRESTALMSKKRGSSLIEYAIAFCASNNIPLHDRTPEGWE